MQGKLQALLPGFLSSLFNLSSITHQASAGGWAMTIRRYLALGLPLWLAASIAGAQTHALSEPVQARDCF